MVSGLGTWLVSRGTVAAAGAAGAAGGASLTCIVKNILGFGIGDLIKKKFPASETKINAWKLSLSEELKNIEEKSKKLISQQISLIFKEISSELSGVKDQSCKEITKLDSKEHDLHEWARKLDECREALEKIKCSFDEPLRE